METFIGRFQSKKAVYTLNNNIGNFKGKLNNPIILLKVTGHSLDYKYSVPDFTRALWIFYCNNHIYNCLRSQSFMSSGCDNSLALRDRLNIMFWCIFHSLKSSCTLLLSYLRQVNSPLRRWSPLGLSIFRWDSLHGWQSWSYYRFLLFPCPFTDSCIWQLF